MRLHAGAVTFALLGTTTSAEVLLYKPTGPYYVTQNQHVLNHTTPDDFTAPDGSGVGKTMLVTTYGPTLSVPQRTRPWVDATNADIWGTALGIPPSLLSSLVTELQWQAPSLSSSTNPGTCPAPAPPLTPHRPAILFLPGAGMPCFAYTAYLSELASWGYTVYAIDHPGEPPYLEFLDGSGGARSAFPPLANWTFPQFEQIYAHRVADAAALLRRGPECLRSLVEQQSSSEQFAEAEQAEQQQQSAQHYYSLSGDGDNGHADPSTFFVFGHSIGGAASAGIMAQQSSSSPSSTTSDPSLPPLLAGANIDGWFFFDIWDLHGNGSASTKPYPDLSPRPFLEIAGQHDPPGPDATWTNFSAAQSGWLRDVGVRGAAHFDFSDLPLLVDALGLRERMPPDSGLLGGIKGGRMVEVVMGLVRAFVGGIEGGKGKGGLGAVDRVQRGFAETWVREAKDGGGGGSG
ncbi:PAF acetylhydrolase family protein [Lasiodiplodia theobromae]|uniref:PAF acetylhydrolase family protein n=1 Tax=Lasiodiplodia theobromae TaxID=45133 RepID=UPI0015C36523|nr:PAF acetylhydrolase family protein [Lasiodiplodia theobromae]KAF4539634.1 PAF acetylhydrolase family protein [Lasiodiplodia theobromae]